MSNSKFTMASKNAKKLATVILPLPIWIDHHIDYYQFELYSTNLTNFLNDLTHH